MEQDFQKNFIKAFLKHFIVFLRAISMLRVDLCLKEAIQNNVTLYQTPVQRTGTSFSILIKNKNMYLIKFFHSPPVYGVKSDEPIENFKKGIHDNILI